MGTFLCVEICDGEMITVLPDTTPDTILIKMLSRAADDVHFGLEPQFSFTYVKNPPEDLASANMVRVPVPVPFPVAIHKGGRPRGILGILVPVIPDGVWSVHEDFVTTVEFVFRQLLVALFWRRVVPEAFTAVRVVLAWGRVPSNRETFGRGFG